MTPHFSKYSQGLLKLWRGIATNRTAFALAFLIIICHYSSAKAEFICGVEVSYKWQKEKGGSKEKDQKAPAPTASAEVSPVAGGDQHDDGSTTVHISSIERAAPDEAGAKALVISEAGRLKTKASEACLRDHENLASCVGTKLASQGATLNGLSFSARKELERAITKDCEDAKGRCMGVLVSDPVCKEKVAPVTPEAAGEGKEKDKKKK